MAYRPYTKRPYTKAAPAPIVRVAAPTYAPSKYQQAILDFLAEGKGNALIQARAGSGKTSTLVMMANAIPTRARSVFLAFNKSIATELATRLPESVASSTFHALGFRAVGPALSARNNGRRAEVDAQKTQRIFDALYDPQSGARSATLKLVSLMKANALMPDAPECELEAIISHYDIECDDENSTLDDVMRMACGVLSRNNEELTSVDFDDMLYLVVVLNVRLDTYDYVMVDESQDLNEIQRIILSRLLAGGGRLFAVGDAAQAIYGFRGASSDSMDRIAIDFNCKRLPLSISYRCPSSVIELAQRFVPDIEARDNAPEGTVLTPTAWKLTDFQPDDLIVCRNTAPLVKTAYRMIAGRIPCKIMGRDIGRGLVVLIQKVAGKRTTLAELPEKISAYMGREVENALRKKQEGKAQSITDKCESILALYDSMTEADRSRGINGLVQIIDSLFSDNGPKVTTLATVHKAKGMEAPRVFILDRKLMPSKFARQDWQHEQERNLEYVAVTRALDTLVFIDSETTR